MTQKIRLVHDDAHKITRKLLVRPPKQRAEKVAEALPPKIVLDFSEKWMRPILKINKKVINSNENLDNDTSSIGQEEDINNEDKPTSQVSSVKQDSKLSQ